MRLETLDQSLIKLPQSQSSPASTGYLELAQISSINGLCPGLSESSALCVSSQGHVLSIGSDLLIKTIYEFAIPSNSFPSVQSAGKSCVLICDGRQSLYAVKYKNDPFDIDWQTTVSLAIVISAWQSTDFSVLLHAALSADEKTLFAVISQHTKPPEGAFKDPNRINFHVHVLSITLENAVTRLLFTTKGQKQPQHVVFDREVQELLILSESLYETVVPIGNSEEASKDTTVQKQQESNHDKYVWTQTDEDVTIHIHLPRNVHKNEIQCHFQKQSVRVRIGTEVILTETTFDATVPSDCFWTLENQNCLSLYLTKQHEKTRWTHVWATDDGVLETLDPHIVDAHTQSLSKYTDTPDSGLFQQAFSEKSEMIDFEGTLVTMARFSVNGQRIQECRGSGFTWLGPCLNPRDPAVCLGYDVDGLIYKFGSTLGSRLEPVHALTLPAFAFVGASKREKRFLGFTSHGDYGIVVESRHVYLYKRPEKCQSESHQWVIEMPLQDFQVRGVMELENHLLLLGLDHVWKVKLSDARLR